jgi:hypothetical protein
MNGWHIVDTVVGARRATVGGTVTVRFRGPKEEQNCGRFPAARIVCNATALVGPDGIAEDDEGYRFQLRRVRDDLWSWTWSVPKSLPSVTGCTLEIAREGQPSLVSKTFNL